MNYKMIYTIIFIILFILIVFSLLYLLIPMKCHKELNVDKYVNCI